MFTGIAKQLGIVEKININDLSGRLQIVVAEKFDKNIIVEQYYYKWGMFNCI